MATVTRTTVWADGQVLSAAALNGEFNNLLNALALTNSDISAGAAIDTSKINASFPSGAIVGTTDSQNISNKTFLGTKQTITTYSPSGGGTATIDLSLGNVNLITMPAGNITIAVSNDGAGKVFIIRILQDSGGSRTVTWFSTIKWPGGNVPTLTTTASKADVFGFVETSAGNFDGFIIGQNL